MPDAIKQLAYDKHTQERFFCACVISAPDTALNDCAWLSPDAFTDKTLGDFWRMVQETGDAINSANVLNLTSELAGWMNKVPNVLTPNIYARGIAEYQYYMDVLSANREIARAAMDRDYQHIQNVVSHIQDSKIGSPAKGYNAIQIGKEFEQTLDSGNSFYVKTHIPPIDKALGGLYGGDLITLAARPGVGKTALAYVIGRNGAFSKKKVLFFSLEMKRVQLWARAVCGHAGYAWRDVRIGNVDERGMKKIKALSAKLQKRMGDNFVVYDDLFSVGEIVQACMSHKPDLVILDHLGEINWDNPKEDEVKWFGKACKIFRHSVAKRMNVPFLLIHQLSREVETRKPPIPILKDLRWSGEVEQRSDVVLMGYREDLYLGGNVVATKVPFELYARKNRQGVVNSKMVMEYDLVKQDFKSWIA